MKKMIFCLFFAGTSCALFAQINDSLNQKWSDTTRTTDDTRLLNKASQNTNSTTGINTSMNSSNAYNAYGPVVTNVPATINMNFEKTYPSATNTVWQQHGDWYLATYAANGRYTHVYYDQRGNTYTLALPVIQTYVPDEIINKVSSMYNGKVYDITALKGANNQNIYQVRTLENGEMKSQWMGDDGNAIMDPYRSVEIDSTMKPMSGINDRETNKVDHDVNTSGHEMNKPESNAKDEDIHQVMHSKEMKSHNKKMKTKSTSKNNKKW